MNDRPNNPAVSEDEIRAALARVLNSRMFSASQRLRRFLEFTVNSLLDGTAAELKETSIGVHVYDRKPTYDKSQDTIVRTEARRLRSKLQEYYRTEGQNDPVVLGFPKGSYAPIALPQSATYPLEHPSAAIASSGDEAGGTEQGILISVLPLVDLSGSTYSVRCARMLTEEFVHGWMHVDGVKVRSLETFPPPLDPGDTVAATHGRGVQFVMNGSVWEENDSLRVTLRLVSPNGLVVWSQKFEAAANPQGLHLLTDRLASALISRLRLERSEIRKGDQTINTELLSVLPTLFEAEALVDDGTGANLQVAAAKFRDILRTSPDLVRALCGLANCYCITALYGVPESDSFARQATEIAERAAGSDQAVILSRTTLAYTRMLDWRWKEAEKTFQEALSLGDHVFTFRQYALYLIARERFDEAGFFIEKAQRVDPFSGRQKVARSLFFHFARRGQELQEHSEEETAFGALPAGLPILLAFSHAQQRRCEDAKRIALGCRRTIGAHPSLMTMVAEVLALCGDGEQARHIASVFKLLSPTPPISFYRQALLSLALGETENAWMFLDKALAAKEPELVWLKVEPRFDTLRHDTRFLPALEKVMPSSVESGIQGQH